MQRQNFIFCWKPTSGRNKKLLTGAYHVIKREYGFYVISETFTIRHLCSVCLIQISIPLVPRSECTDTGAAENGVPGEIADGISQVHVHFLPSPQSFLFTSCHSFSPGRCTNGYRLGMRPFIVRRRGSLASNPASPKGGSEVPQSPLSHEPSRQA